MSKHTSVCGCTAEWGVGFLDLQRCPLHTAAHDLLAACEAAAAHFENERIVLGHGDDGPCNCQVCTETEPLVRAAITKARGEQL